MHKSKGSFKAQAIRKYQENLKKIKKRKVASIWDIINDPDLHFFQKVDYIRHHFVYYDGNYELFHDKNGKPTHTKKLLDQVIAGIVNKKIDPSELNELNKEILKDHKARMEQTEAQKEQQLNEYLQEYHSLGTSSNDTTKPTIVKEEKYVPELATYKQGIVNADAYFKIIDKYIESLSEEDRLKVATWSYRELKTVAKAWARENKSYLLKPEKKPIAADSFNALLKGYKKYAKKEWKNTPEEQ